MTAFLRGLVVSSVVFVALVVFALYEANAQSKPAQTRAATTSAATTTGTAAPSSTTAQSAPSTPTSTSPSGQATSTSVKVGDATLTGNAQNGSGFYLHNCLSCHARDGQAFIVSYPRLSAQIPGYTADQLVALRSGKRKSGVMNAIAAGLTDQQIADLATYLASTEVAPPWKSTETALRESGQKLYTAGNPSTGVSACAGCHGADGRGNAAAGFPLIAGQSPAYFAKRIAELAAGNTDDNPNAAVMVKIAKAMTPAETRASAEYVKTLPTTGATSGTDDAPGQSP